MSATYKLLAQAGTSRYLDEASGVTIDIPAGDDVTLVQPPQVAAIPTSAIQQALLSPVGSHSLVDLAKGCRRVAIITSDSTRSVPCARLLDQILPMLLSAGIQIENITVVVALGVHRPATQAEMDGYLGSWKGRLKIINHDAFDPDRLSIVGRTSRGNEVRINRTVAEADLRIALGQVEPHEFAGFSGGPKSVLAGVSSEEAIKSNHSPQMLMHPLALPGVTYGNPIWEDILEAAIAADIQFIVNVILTPELEIAGVVAGALESAHAAAIALYQQIYRVAVPLNDSADIVVTTPGHPLDMNLYQSIKPLVAVQNIVRPGGVVVLYANCSEGTGGAPFVAPFENAASPREVISRLSTHGAYRIEMDHALLLCRMQLSRQLKFIFCTPGVSPDIIRSMFCTVATSPQDAYNKARVFLTRGNDRSIRTVLYPKPQKIAPRS